MESPNLTPRQWEILELAAKGNNPGKIAKILGIGIYTVHSHSKKIAKALKCNDLGQAIAIAKKQNLFRK